MDSWSVLASGIDPNLTPERNKTLVAKTHLAKRTLTNRRFGLG